jgi:hypothetical protein
VNPDEGSLPVPVTGDRSLSFSWSPDANDGEDRSVTADLTTSGQPAEFRVTLQGVPGSGGTALDLSGTTIEQISSSVSIVLPEGLSLEADDVLVIGRSAERAAFESFWGTMPPRAVYINGFAAAGGNGFPVINGDERYRVLDASGVARDPETGYLPSAPIQAASSYERIALEGSAFTRRDAGDATPGSYGGTLGGTGGLRIAEISDAPGSGNYIYEFIEFVYDAAETSGDRVTLSLY